MRPHPRYLVLGALLLGLLAFGLRWHYLQTHWFPQDDPSDPQGYWYYGAVLNGHMLHECRAWLGTDSACGFQPAGDAVVARYYADSGFDDLRANQNSWQAFQTEYPGVKGGYLPPLDILLSRWNLKAFEVAAAFWVFGPRLESILLLQTLMMALTALGVAWLAGEWSGRAWVAGLAGLAWALYPVTINFLQVTFPQWGAALCMVLGLAALVRGLRLRAAGWVLLGLLAWLVFALYLYSFRLWIVLLIVGWALYTLRRPHQIPGLRAMLWGLLGALAALTLLLYPAREVGLTDHTTDMLRGTGSLNNEHGDTGVFESDGWITWIPSAGAFPEMPNGLGRLLRFAASEPTTFARFVLLESYRLWMYPYWGASGLEVWGLPDVLPGLNLGVVYHQVMVGLGGLGLLWLWARRWGAGLLLASGALILCTATYAVFSVQTRYTLPLAPILAAAAVAGNALLLERLRHHPRVIVAGGLLLGLIVLGYAPLVRLAPGRAAQDGFGLWVLGMVITWAGFVALGWRALRPARRVIDEGIRWHSPPSPLPPNSGGGLQHALGVPSPNSGRAREGSKRAATEHHSPVSARRGWLALVLLGGALFLGTGWSRLDWMPWSLELAPGARATQIITPAPSPAPNLYPWLLIDTAQTLQAQAFRVFVNGQAVKDADEQLFVWLARSATDVHTGRVPFGRSWLAVPLDPAALDGPLRVDIEAGAEDLTLTGRYPMRAPDDYWGVSLANDGTQHAGWREVWDGEARAAQRDTLQGVRYTTDADIPPGHLNILLRWAPFSQLMTPGEDYEAARYHRQPLNTTGRLLWDRETSAYVTAQGWPYVMLHADDYRVPQLALQPERFRLIHQDEAVVVFDVLDVHPHPVDDLFTRMNDLLAARRVMPWLGDSEPLTVPQRAAWHQLIAAWQALPDSPIRHYGLAESWLQVDDVARSRPHWDVVYEGVPGLALRDRGRYVFLQRIATLQARDPARLLAPGMPYLSDYLPAWTVDSDAVPLSLDDLAPYEVFLVADVRTLWQAAGQTQNPVNAWTDAAAAYRAVNAGPVPFAPVLAPDGVHYGLHRTTLGPAPQPSHALNAVFDGQIVLRGYDLARDEAGGLTLVLYWAATESGVRGEYSVFVHVYDGETFIAQRDGPPVNGLFITPYLRDDVAVPDVRHLDTARPDAPLRLAVGLYGVEGARLPLPDGADAVWLDVE